MTINNHDIKDLLGYRILCVTATIIQAALF